MRPVYALGRFVFGAFFLYNGINHLTHTAALAPYAASKRLAAPEEAVKLTGVLLTLSGASLALGIKPRLGAAGALAFLAGISPVMHDFWRQEDPGQRQAEMIHFAKNMALLGAAVALLGD